MSMSERTDLELEVELLHWLAKGPAKLVHLVATIKEDKERCRAALHRLKRYGDTKCASNFWWSLARPLDECLARRNELTPAQEAPAAADDLLFLIDHDGDLHIQARDGAEDRGEFHLTGPEARRLARFITRADPVLAR